MGMPEIVKNETGKVAPERREGERSEPSRSGGATFPAAADPEVSTKAMRRQFSAAYKRRVLQEADEGGPGAIAGLLRREGLYSSHLNTWRKQRESGEIAGLAPRKRGKKPVPRNPLTAENEQLRQENARLQKRLHQAETIVAVQKKLCDLLGLTVPPIEQNGSDE
jgi:transposase